MTEHQWRAPVGVRAIGRGRNSALTLPAAEDARVTASKSGWSTARKIAVSVDELKSQPVDDERKTAPVASALKTKAVAGARLKTERSGLALSFEASGAERNFAPWETSDLFAVDTVNGTQIDPHPTFEARAAIWRDQRAGLISIAEAQRRSAAIGAPQTRATGSHVRSSVPARPRHSRPAPNASRQYSGTMATTAARDDRLTPNAKAMLQVIRARCGKGRETSTCKSTLAAIMSRSARSIRRYLVDLVRWGYLEIETRRTAWGLHTGLVIRITEKALPFFAETTGLARWLAETEPFKPFAASRPADNRVTLLTPKNEFRKSLLSEVKNSALRRVGVRLQVPI